MSRRATLSSDLLDQESLTAASIHRQTIREDQRQTLTAFLIRKNLLVFRLAFLLGKHAG
ncbi:hypothetical protein MUN89_09110 [Halobacillus salinarum]|uniref:Uncharacterized protein n=1 Tax=Halobacillus salinarum TaxID=2932257 RepID=A0ABY4EQB0_9BACI|nr:hypothetical protein [Halobacillus salinarum]UOQ46053.1 hypothetical protein MUN89_09110 [Halobacillus salinarum]